MHSTFLSAGLIQRTRSIRILSATFLVLAVSSMSLQARGQSLTEYRVKTAILHKLANFVDWPEHSMNSNASAIGICVVGTDSLSSHLDALIGQTVKGKNIVIERVEDDRNLPQQCNIVFISQSERSRLDEVLQSLNNRTVLTVSDQEGFARYGGMINLRIVENKVRFDINVEAARKAGLKISAKLLRLATLVQTSP